LAFFNLKLYGITVEGDILGLQDGFLSYLPLIYLIQIGSYLIETGEILTIIITILAYVIVVVAYLNFVIDLIGLNVATKRSHRVLSFIRFVVMFVLLVAYLLIALIGSAFYFKMVGAIFYLTFILAFLQVAVAVIRLIAANRARAKAIKEQKNEAFNFGQEETVESEEQTTTQTVIDMAEGQDEHYDEESDTVVKIVKAPVQEQAVEPAETVAQTPVEETSQPIEEQLIIPEAQSYEVPAEAQSAAEAQPAYAAPIFAQPAQEPAQTNATPNNNFIYHYTGDKFINTLNTVEKAEFARLFLENKTPYNNVPTYVIGGNNEKFFSSIFIYLGKFRGILSDGLINKIYMQINLLH
jgi:hypothetical protein